MEAEIDLNHALLIVGIAAACLCLFFLMMVCFLSPHCPLNRCVPCAPRYDELDEYEEDPKCKSSGGFVYMKKDQSVVEDPGFSLKGSNNSSRCIYILYFGLPQENLTEFKIS